ncbi:hypothetical protein T4D_10296 [Trichinella pseudospiralis]|uniref:Uncharacterized protein n=1 Tax=Trichinella pseudospiralis TaxID=6337 RepID=A0A0V1DRG6_TRIPS|nr:hypothetical protein T4D_10296 [Trichinella pseudospiralis]
MQECDINCALLSLKYNKEINHGAYCSLNIGFK